MRLIALVLVISMVQSSYYLTEYEALWHKGLSLNNLSYIFEAFWKNNLFNTEFLIYLNNDGIDKVGQELGFELPEMEIYKISTIAWKIHYKQNQIDPVGIYEYVDVYQTNELHISSHVPQIFKP
eukprot:97146_1